MSTDWSKHYATGAGFRYWPNEELVRMVGDRQFGEVLEAGCGNGANLWFLAEHADTVFGVDGEADIVVAAGAYMDRRLPPEGAVNVRLFCGDVRRLAMCEQGTIDLVVDCMTSQHLPWAEHARLYAEYRRVLRPGGLLWLYHLDSRTSSHRLSCDFVCDCDWRRLALFPDVDYFCLPCHADLTRVVEEAGFRLQQVRGLGREYGAPDFDVAHYTVVTAEAT